MTQLDNGQPAPTPVEQGADPAGVAAGVTASPAAPDDGFIRIPKDALSSYGGDYHEAIRLAKQGRQYEQDGTLSQLQALSARHGVSLQDVLGWLDSPQQQEQPVEAPPVAPTEQPAGSIFDPVEFRKSLLGDIQDTLQKRDQDQQQATTQAEQQRLYNEAIAAEDTARADFLKARSLARPEDGSRSPKFNAANSMFWENVMEAKKAMIPAHVVDSQQRQAYLNQPASAELLASVAEQTGKDLQDLMAEGAAAFATNQEPTAGVSLDHGPGASAPLPDGDTMTAEQEDAFITDGMADE